MLMSKQMGVLKVHYEKTSTILKDVESKAVFDSRFGVYNRRYFLKNIESECKSIEQFNHRKYIGISKNKR